MCTRVCPHRAHSSVIYRCHGALRRHRSGTLGARAVQSGGSSCAVLTMATSRARLLFVASSPFLATICVAADDTAQFGQGGGWDTMQAGDDISQGRAGSLASPRFDETASDCVDASPATVVSRPGSNLRPANCSVTSPISPPFRSRSTRHGCSLTVRLRVLGEHA